MSKPRKSLTDWPRVDALRDEDIDLSDNPEVSVDMMRRAVVRRNLRKLTPTGRESIAKTESVTLRLDADVLDALRASGPGWQSRLRAGIRRLVMPTVERAVQWSTAEDEMLLKIYRDEGIHGVRRAFPSRTETAMRQRLNMLGGRRGPRK